MSWIICVTKFKSFINDRNPSLLLYNSGYGGEHITSVLTQSCSSFYPLSTRYFTANNRYNVNCVLRYIDAGPVDIDDMDGFIDYDALTNLGKSDIILKDHPVPKVFDFYAKHFPGIRVIFLDTVTERKYFNDVACAKMGNKIQTDDINKLYISTHVDSTLTQHQCDIIVHKVSEYEWIWEHELFHLVSRIKIEQNVEFLHDDSLESFRNDHYEYGITQLQQLKSRFKSNFVNFYEVNIDSMRYEGIQFWNDMKVLYPTLDVETAIRLSSHWIENNHSLILREI